MQAALDDLKKAERLLSRNVVLLGRLKDVRVRINNYFEGDSKMKREFAALIGVAFLISAMPCQLMGWSVTAWILGAIGVAAEWKSGYRIHVHTEED